VGKKLLGAKSPVRFLNSILKVRQKSNLLNQPDLANLDSRQFSTTQQPANVLQIVATEFSSGLDGYVIGHYNQGRMNRIHLKPRFEMRVSSSNLSRFSNRSRSKN